MKGNRVKITAIIAIATVVISAIVATAVVTGLGVTATGVIDTAAVMSGLTAIAHIATGEKEKGEEVDSPSTNKVKD